MRQKASSRRCFKAGPVGCTCGECGERSAHARHEEPSVSIPPAAGADCGQRQDGGAGPAGRRRVRAVDRLRQSREPAECSTRVRARLAAACGRRRRPASRSTIVGVLKDVKQGGVDKEAGTELYFNFEQLTAFATGYGIGMMNIVIRTTQPADALSGTIRSAVAGLDPSRRCCSACGRPIPRPSPASSY